MKRNTKIALVMMALSAMAMGSTSAFAHGGHGMWQQNAAPLTSEQQTAWQKIHNDFYAQSSALQQQLVTKRYEYNALLAANPPDSSKINAVAKEMENLRQSLDELRVKRDIAMAEAGIPRGAGMGMGYGGVQHRAAGLLQRSGAAAVVAVIWVWATGKSERFLVGLPATEIRVCHQQ